MEPIEREQTIFSDKRAREIENEREREWFKTERQLEKETKIQCAFWLSFFICYFVPSVVNRAVEIYI